MARYYANREKILEREREERRVKKSLKRKAREVYLIANADKIREERRAYRRRYYHKNRDKLLSYGLEYRASNQSFRDNRRAYVDANRDRHNVYTAAYRARNLETIREMQRARAARKAEKRKKELDKIRAWKLENRDKIAAERKARNAEYYSVWYRKNKEKKCKNTRAEKAAKRKTKTLLMLMSLPSAIKETVNQTNQTNP